MNEKVSRRDWLLGGTLALGSTAVAQGALSPAGVAQDTPRRKSLRAPFAADFLWGTATSAYQIEGAVAEAGRGPSVWDSFCTQKGAVFDGHTGALACDHYHRVDEDVALMRMLGANSYRFSLSWTRLLPAGRGAVNEQGVAFYDRLIDRLLAANIRPMGTLFHWDYPQALQAQGGWLTRDSADWFADYAELVVRRFSDRVALWTTQNEPQCYIGMGLLLGTHAPGLKLPFAQYLTAAHNSMRAHGKAVLAMRAAAKRPLELGYVISTQSAHPATERAEDIEAAREAFFRVERADPWNNAWWLDPVLKGVYPEQGLVHYHKHMPLFPSSDLAEMRQPIDFVGLNIYGSQPFIKGAKGLPEAVPLVPGYPRSGVDWQEIMPAAMYWAPRFVHERYGLPIYITENGLSTRDQVFLDGKVHDPQRADFLHRYLLELARALGDGIPVKGYYHWSLLDNFEWADGYKQRFGLVYVDFGNQRRIPKDSFHFYRRVIASQGAVLKGRHAVAVDHVTG